MANNSGYPRHSTQALLWNTDTTADEVGVEAIELDPTAQRERSINARYRRRHILTLIILFAVVVFAILGFVTLISDSKFRWQEGSDGSMEKAPTGETLERGRT